MEGFIKWLTGLDNRNKCQALIKEIFKIHNNNFLIVLYNPFCREVLFNNKLLKKIKYCRIVTFLPQIKPFKEHKAIL
jgi:hypothetical protein